MRGDSQENFPTTFGHRVRPRVFVERRFVRPAETRHVFQNYVGVRPFEHHTVSVAPIAKSQPHAVQPLGGTHLTALNVVLH